MKRIAFLMCGLVLLVANTAEARRGRSCGGNCGYSQQPIYTAPAMAAAPATVRVTAAKPVTTAPASATASAKKPLKVAPATQTKSAEKTVKTTPVSKTTTTVAKAPIMKNAFDTSTAQGVANIMASRGYVGHFGGNPGYEGCGMGPTKQAAYSICCYGNSGMATVDVGYAQGANGMWYCCRRYR